MKVAIIFLGALALLSLTGNTTARITGTKANCIYGVEGCPRIYDPVCGMDGTTYPNECTLCSENRERKVAVLIRNYGPC